MDMKHYCFDHREFYISLDLSHLSFNTWSMDDVRPEQVSNTFYLTINQTTKSHSKIIVIFRMGKCALIVAWIDNNIVIVTNMAGIAVL